MADATTQIASQTVPQASSANSHRHRQRRRGGAAFQRQVEQQSEPQLQSQQTSHQVQPGRGGRGRRFGGQLTRADSLSAQAIDFVPASVTPSRGSKAVPIRQPQATQATQAQPRQTGKQNATLTRQFSRSTAPDLATRIHEDINHELYECAICSNEITRRSKVWSCDQCWMVFHIGCIKKWSKNDGSTVPRQQGSDSEDFSGKHWRCPGCNLPKHSLPTAYNCWCEKEMDPKVITGLPPHSCGQTCGRDRKFPKACPHPCDQICHAGPCPPCTSIGSVQSCFCGKHSSTRRCVETDYEAGWSCGEVCGDMMPCGEHFCERPCHEGVCGSCTVEVLSKCYCGKVEKTIPCELRQEEKESYEWTGTFNCMRTCGRKMDCGIHECEKTCHPQDLELPHCPKSPDVVDHCGCGKTLLSELTNKVRTTCTDPIPSCDKPCGKTLSCGHICNKPCHTGDCPLCTKKIPLACRCGRTVTDTTCYGGESTFERPWCTRTCRITLNCGRHECGERCCPGERAAIERLARKRGKKPLLDADGVPRRDEFESEHICTRTCDRPLKCGNHTCPDLCHKGPCGSCKEAIFDDLSCDCGRTTLIAPLPCGSRPPPCNFPCQRTKSCGHPQVAHNCHTGEENCPKCPFLTTKPCLCGKKTLKNQACWRTDVLCGLICGKTLKCGSHTCRKTCHKPGECEDAVQHCSQECGKPKRTCGHPCEQPCHAPSACKEEKACPFKIMITCDCQRKKEEVRCNARANVAEPAGRQTSLKCDDECLRLERNRKLAAALHIEDEHMDDHVPYSNTTLNMYVNNATWCHEQEEILRVFAADKEEKRYRFPPMKARHRAFIHSLAEDFGFDGESLDPEPHRHILLFKTPKFVAAPMKTLAQAARVRRAQLAMQPPVEAENSGTSTPRSRADEVVEPDYNGLILRKPRFALTEDEVHPVVKIAAPTNDFTIHFLHDIDAVALLPKDEWSTAENTSLLLHTHHPTISNAVIREGLAQSANLCQFDLDGMSAGGQPLILHEAGVASPSGIQPGGWSQVAAKRALPMAAPTKPAVGQKSSFTVLGSKLAEAKKKQKEEKKLEKERAKMAAEPVVDDWSAEIEKEEAEEKSRGVSENEIEDHFLDAEERRLVPIEADVD